MKIKWLSAHKDILVEGGSLSGLVGEHLMRKLADEVPVGELDKRIVSVEQIAFVAPIFRWAWNGFHFLNLVHEADIRLENRSNVWVISARFYFTELAVLCFVFTSLPGLAMAQHLIPQALVLFALVWVVFFIGGVFLALGLFERWVEKTQSAFIVKQLAKRI
ncbi:MAG: hypothetical protein RIS47_1152 [Bacteroidota bacterium]|jgi:hypothetical protein